MTRVHAEALGAYEAAIGSHIAPDGPHWIYYGREDINDVRLFVIATFDPDYPLTPDTTFTSTCRRAHCVRPPHLIER